MNENLYAGNVPDLIELKNKAGHNGGEEEGVISIVQARERERGRKA